MLIGLIPVFNEEKTILNILQKMEKYVDYIVIVNDGSSDNTDSLITGWAINKERKYYISLRNNRGMAYALLQGFNLIFDEHRKGIFSRNDAVVTIDADEQHNPEDILGMYSYFMNNNLDLLIARRDFSVYPRYRILGNKLLSIFVSCLAKFKFYDVQCGFKILRLSLISDLLSFYTAFRYSCACQIGIIASRLGYNIDNNYLIDSPYYRKGGPGIFDFFVDLLLYSLVTLKIQLARKK